jgi:putative ABC transport system permease protein
MRGFAQDLRFTLRLLRRSPGFTIASVTALALGIGANSAIFSVVDAVVLRPLPLPQPEQVVDVAKTGPQGGPGANSFPDFGDWHSQSKSFSHLSVYHDDSVVLTDGGEPERVQALAASADFFGVLGISPALGRGFAAGEDTKGKNRVVVISHALWQKHFAGDRAVVGRTTHVDGEPYTVIGVLPPGLRYPLGTDTDLYMPFPHGQTDERLSAIRGAHYLSGIGRLKPGVAPAAAQAEMTTIAFRLAQAYPDSNANRPVRVTPLQESLVGSVRPALFVLLGAVGLVLLIACANVANLLLARATVRQKEIAIRSALGAGRGRVVRQLLTESVLLALCGGGLGIVMALWGLDALAGLIPDDIPRLNPLAVDARVLIFTAGVAVLTGVLFGLVPALQVSRPQLQSTLGESGRGATSGTHLRMRQLLLVGEVAVSLTLLVGAGLLLRSFIRLRGVDPGFDSRDVLTAAIPLPENVYHDAEMVSFYRRLMERLDAMPGAKQSAAVMPLPMSGSNSRMRFEIYGRPPPDPGHPLVSDIRWVSPSYYATLRIPLRDGRLLTRQDDDPAAPDVAIVNEAFARTYFPGERAVGKRIRRIRGTKPVWETIVGVTADIHHEGLEAQPRPEIDAPFAKGGWPIVFLAVRGQPGVALQGSLTAAVRELDKNLPLAQVKTMDELLGDTLAQRRMSLFLLALFAAVALILAAVGIYGVTAYSVTQRTREIGIRVALGARRGQVVGMVVGQSLRLALLGVGLGAVGALALTRVLAGMLWGIRSWDPVTFGSIAVLLTAVAALASWLPARRATRVDPMLALRAE